MVDGSEMIQIFDTNGKYMSHYYSCIKPCINEAIMDANGDIYIVKKIMHIVQPNSFDLRQVDIELSKRIFLENEQGDEFTIRYFIESQGKKQWTANYTVYKTVNDDDGSSHGEQLYNGSAKAKYLFE